MKLSTILKAINDNYTEKLKLKSSWGKVEVLAMYKDVVNEQLMELIGDRVDIDNNNDFNWIYDDEKVTLKDKLLQNKKNKQVADIPKKTNEEISNEITSKQLYTIAKIEERLNVKFNGSNKFDAIKFISTYIDKSKNFKTIEPNNIDDDNEKLPAGVL